MENYESMHEGIGRWGCQHVSEGVSELVRGCTVTALTDSSPDGQ